MSIFTEMKTRYDQATQVDFPVVPKSLHKRLRRHHTSSDLLQIPNRLSGASSWSHIRTVEMLRPRSLQPDGFKSRINMEQSFSRLTVPISEVSTISRERSPPFSCNSSNASTPPNGFRFYPPVKPKLVLNDEESTGSSCRCCCRCYQESEHPKKTFYRNSEEELSWRRLHMSRAKLKATSTTSELLSGFAMVAMVELQINEPTEVPEWLFVMFAVCTTVLVSVHIFALMISTYILPNIDAIAKLDICEMVSESPHERMKGYIEIAWAFSTVLGLFLFLVEVAILCWVKFWDTSFPAAIGATTIVIPVLIILVMFAVHFYHSLVVFRVDTSQHDIDKLEEMKKQLDQVTATSPL